MSIFKSMKTKLKNLLVKELSLVDRGANQGAKVVLFKHEDKNGDIVTEDSIKDLFKGIENSMKPEDLIKQLGETLTAQLAPVIAKVEALEKKAADKDEAEKAMNDEKAKKAADEKAEKDAAEKDASDKTEKALPEDIQKVLKAAQDAHKIEIEKVLKVANDATELAKAEKAAREKLEVEKKLDTEYPYLQGTTDEKISLFKSLEGSEFGLSTLKALNDANKEKMGEKGHSASVAKSAEDKLEVIVKSLQEKDSTLTHAQAYVKALESSEGQKLYTELL